MEEITNNAIKTIGPMVFRYFTSYKYSNLIASKRSKFLNGCILKTIAFVDWRFREALEDAVTTVQSKESSRQLVFFIDELDRCRPTFAIELLERVKHLFDVKGMVFVLSIDKKQLEAITAAVYGERIDAREYLRRFIDLEFSLPSMYSEGLTKALMARYGLDAFFQARRKNSDLAYDEENFVDTFTALSRLFNLSLRVREHCLTRLAVVLNQTEGDHYLDPIFVAFLIVLRAKKPDFFERLISGSTSPDELLEHLWAEPGGLDFKSDKLAVVIACYLYVGDPNVERRESRFREFGKLVASEKQTPEAIAAYEIIEMRKHVPQRSFGRTFNILQVARKVDIAAMLDR